MLYYSTNGSLTTKCSLQEKVERIADAVKATDEFQEAVYLLMVDSCYSVSAFESDVNDMVFRYLNMANGDRAKRLKKLHKAVVNQILRFYV